MNVLKSVLSLASDTLKNSGVSNPDREAAYVLMDLLGYVSYNELMAHANVLDRHLLNVYQERIKRRSLGVPVAYLSGSVRFFDLTLNVSNKVLIPRLETELLVEKVIMYLKKRPYLKIVYDVCCGSGCIGLSIKKHLPYLDVVLSDISLDALEVARENAHSNQLDVTFLQGDLMKPFTKPCDLLVCNPPYLSFREIVCCDPEVRCHEPWLALVGGSSGYEYYERLALDIEQYLNPHGSMWCEIGYNQGDYIKKIFMKSGYFDCFVEKDLAGLDRFFFLEADKRDAVL